MLLDLKQKSESGSESEKTRKFGSRSVMTRQVGPGSESGSRFLIIRHKIRIQIRKWICSTGGKTTPAFEDQSGLNFARFTGFSRNYR